MNDTVTSIAGIRVGHWVDPQALTGCTVVVLPEPNVITAEVRGAAPGTRELALLAPGMRVEQAQAVVLTGGSAFGLAAADGVVRELVAQGRGHPTPAGPVPIVPGAVIYDLMTGDPSVRPGPVEGAAAFRAATDAPVTSGPVGAGIGATVAKWRGAEAIRPGGLGSASVDIDGARVAALAVVNAIGDVFSLEGEPLTGGPPVPGPPPTVPPIDANSTLLLVATDAGFGRQELTRLIVRAHDALGACVRPVHTRYDGDVCFAVTCGTAEADLDHASEAAFEAVGRAIQRAVVR